jgi:hypothetical protein
MNKCEKIFSKQFYILGAFFAFFFFFFFFRAHQHMPRTFTKDTALSEQGRGTAWHV